MPCEAETCCPYFRRRTIIYEQNRTLHFFSPFKTFCEDTCDPGDACFRHAVMAHMLFHATQIFHASDANCTYRPGSRHEDRRMRQLSRCQ
eukprot:3867680-Pleurochrysis_carterae.AAC.1